MFDGKFWEKIYNRPLFGSESFYRNLLAYFLIVTALWLILDPVETSLFSGSEWRNAQTYAALPCFREAGSFMDVVRCYFAPPLGFSDGHYIGLEHPVIQFLDWVLGSEVNIYTVKSKMQLLALILTLTPVILFLRFSLLSVFAAVLYIIALLDNPTLNFFALSYQPDLFSMGLIFTGAALGLKDKNDISYIPEVLVGLGIMVKPQHGLIALSLLMCVRMLRMNLSRRSFVSLFLRSFVTAIPTGLFVVSNKVALMSGIGVPYPGLGTSIGGMSLFPRETVIEVFKQMLPRNGYEFLYIVFGLYVLALCAAFLRRKGFFGALFTGFSGMTAYVVTYVIFVIGFIANIYYGSVLFLTLNLLTLNAFRLIFNSESEKPLISWKNFAAIAVGALIIFGAVKYLGRPAEHFTILLRDRHKMCDPAEIRDFADTIASDNIYLNNRKLEPTIRTSLERGTNLWYHNLDAFREIKKEGIEAGADYYYFSCSYFNDLLYSDEKAVKFIEGYADKIYENGEWKVWKLK